MTQQWTLPELAQAAKDGGRPVTTGYLRRLCRNGARRGGIDGDKLGRDWVVRDSEARRWLDEWLKRVNAR